MVRSGSAPALAGSGGESREEACFFPDRREEDSAHGKEEAASEAAFPLYYDEGRRDLEPVPTEA